jgi:hypothetical protein
VGVSEAAATAVVFYLRQSANDHPHHVEKKIAQQGNTLECLPAVRNDAMMAQRKQIAVQYVETMNPRKTQPSGKKTICSYAPIIEDTVKN